MVLSFLCCRFVLGREATGSNNDEPTDPFMVFIAPIEGFDTSAGLATANFCEIRGSAQVSVL